MIVKVHASNMEISESAAGEFLCSSSIHAFFLKMILVNRKAESAEVTEKTIVKILKLHPLR